MWQRTTASKNLVPWENITVPSPWPYSPPPVRVIATQGTLGEVSPSRSACGPCAAPASPAEVPGGDARGPGFGQLTLDWEAFLFSSVSSFWTPQTQDEDDRSCLPPDSYFFKKSPMCVWLSVSVKEIPVHLKMHHWNSIHLKAYKREKNPWTMASTDSYWSTWLRVYLPTFMLYTSASPSPRAWHKQDCNEAFKNWTRLIHWKNRAHEEFYLEYLKQKLLPQNRGL